MITRGFGMTMDLERGTTRNWAMGSDGVKRWVDTGEQCYSHIPPKPAFRVTATYRHIGKIPPRKFTDDDCEKNP